MRSPQLWVACRRRSANLVFNAFAALAATAPIAVPASGDGVRGAAVPGAWVFRSLQAGAGAAHLVALR